MQKFYKTFIVFIEKNYTSNKIKYGWDSKNKEGYNDLSLLENLIVTNDISNNLAYLITIRKIFLK